ncbi:MAG: response regulator, partial [Clostridiales bacterium]|nr:response regulator [Clostridiales bacterium]
MELIKVLIADDENLAIEDLTDLFDWEGNGFVIIATAKNGEQALQKFNKYSPHIVITDIKMPIMSGIELAKAIRKNSRSTSIVFLSGYAEFEYAKQALDLNVEDYILKNEINAEKLSSKMLEIKSKLFTSDKVRQRTVQGVATEVFNHRKSLDAFAVSPDAIVREFVQGSYYYLIIEEDLPLPFIMLSEDTTEEILPVSIIDFCMSIEDDNFKVMSVCDIKPTRFLLTIRGSCRLTSFNQFAMLKQFAIRLQNKLKGQFQLSCSLFTFPRVLHLDAAYQDYLRLKDRIYSKYLLGTSLILDLEDDLLKGQTENVDYDGTYVQRLIDDRNIIELHNYIDSVFKEILRKKSYPALVLVTRVMLGAIDRNGNELKYIKSGKSFKTYSFKDKTLWLDIHSIKALLKDKFSEINDIFVENSK